MTAQAAPWKMINHFLLRRSEELWYRGLAPRVVYALGLGVWKSQSAEKHYCILFYMSLVGSVGIVGMDDIFLSVGLVRLFELVFFFR